MSGVYSTHSVVLCKLRNKPKNDELRIIQRLTQNTKLRRLRGGHLALWLRWWLGHSQFKSQCLGLSSSSILNSRLLLIITHPGRPSDGSNTWVSVPRETQIEFLAVLFSLAPVLELSICLCSFLSLYLSNNINK